MSKDKKHCVCSTSTTIAPIDPEKDYMAMGSRKFMLPMFPPLHPSEEVKVRISTVNQGGGKKDAIGDSNKPRLSLIPKRALWALGGALTYGEKHYGTHNWRQGISVSFLLDAALRHINEFGSGENIDEKSQNHHLGNAMANLAMAIEICATKPELDDRYKNQE